MGNEQRTAMGMPTSKMIHFTRFSSRKLMWAAGVLLRRIIGMAGPKQHLIKEALRLQPQSSAANITNMPAIPLGVGTSGNLASGATSLR